MTLHVNPAYYQHNGTSKAHMTAVVNPAYFQPGYLHHENASPVHGRGGRKGTTKHAKAGVHGRHPHESPLPPMRDPFKHRGMGKVR